jgi:hypothetical protein
MFAPSRTVCIKSYHKYWPSRAVEAATFRHNLSWMVDHVQKQAGQMLSSVLNGSEFGSHISASRICLEFQQTSMMLHGLSIGLQVSSMSPRVYRSSRSRSLDGPNGLAPPRLFRSERRLGVLPVCSRSFNSIVQAFDTYCVLPPFVPFRTAFGGFARLFTNTNVHPRVDLVHPAPNRIKIRF